jgi:hypothetical protein
MFRAFLVPGNPDWMAPFVIGCEPARLNGRLAPLTADDQPCDGSRAQPPADLRGIMVAI